MKNIKTKLNTGFILLSFLGIFAFVSVLALPMLGAKTASAQYAVASCNSATLNGHIETNGATTQVWFEWGPGSSIIYSTSVQTFSSPSNFSQVITGLTENSTYSYRAMAQNQNGTSTGATLTFRTTCGQSSQPSVNLTADDTSIDEGDSTTVRWNSSNADFCTASGGTNNWSGSRGLSGSFNTGSLFSTRTYSITCSNNYGSASDSVTIRVNDNNDDDGNINVDLRADDTSIDYGDSTILRWDSDNADDCRASGGTNGWSGDRNLNGSFRTGSLYDDTTYRIRCTNDDGDSDDDSITIRVTDRDDRICRDTSASNYLGNLPCRYAPVNNQPTVVITADSTSVAFNGSTTIRWGSVNATSCNAFGGSIGWAGPKSTGSGSFFTGSLSGTRTYSITCSNNVGSATDSVTVNVRGQVLGVTTTPTALLVVNSSVDRNRPIVPTIDNTNPCPGDEINYTLTYQNIGTGAVRNLVLRVDLPYEVSYLSSSPGNPGMSGNGLVFSLGTLGANKSGTVTIRVLVRNDAVAGANLNFPATLTYTDPSGMSQSVNANVSANVCTVAVVTDTDDTISLGAAVFGAGFLPTSILGWLLLIILILILILLAKYLFGQSFQRKTITTFEQPAIGKKTTTTTTL